MSEDILKKLGVTPDGARVMTNEQNIAEITLKFDRLIADALDDKERACFRFQKANALATNAFMGEMHDCEVSYLDLLYRVGEALACMAVMATGPASEGRVQDALRATIPELKDSSGPRIAAGMVAGSFHNTINEHVSAIDAGKRPLHRIVPKEARDGG